MFDKNSVMCMGSAGLLFTDENGKSYLVDSHKLLLGENERVLFSNRIERFDSKQELTNIERETIIAKVMELTPEIKWKIQ